MKTKAHNTVQLFGAIALLCMGGGCASHGQRRPSAGSQLASGLVRTQDAVPTRGEWGQWLRYFRGDTYGTKDMIVLAVTLKPGQAPHPPHRHAEEEFMILTEGAGTWHLDGKDSPARKGDTVYAAPWTMHGLRNTSDAPLTYYMVKWGSKELTKTALPARQSRE